MRPSLAVLISLCIAAPAGPAISQGELAEAGDDPLDLIEAYQSGYFQVVAVSCFQLYASTGIIDSNYNGGFIDGETALLALEQNSLLHSVCVTTLARIEELTPADDELAQDEIGRLLAVLGAEGELIRALRDAFTEPSEENDARVEAALSAVEEALESYVGQQ